MARHRLTHLFLLFFLFLILFIFLSPFPDSHSPAISKNSTFIVTLIQIRPPPWPQFLCLKNKRLTQGEVGGTNWSVIGPLIKIPEGFLFCVESFFYPYWYVQGLESLVPKDSFSFYAHPHESENFLYLQLTPGQPPSLSNSSPVELPPFSISRTPTSQTILSCVPLAELCQTPERTE